VRTLVTGASGFIGVHTARALIAAGHEVVALVRPRSPREALEAVGVRSWALGDLAEPESLARAVVGVDAVIHLASLLKVPWKPEFRSVNIGGTAALAEACAAQVRPPVLVVVSSLAAGGPAPQDRARTEQDGAQPVSAYGHMKLACEAAARAQAARVPVTIVRPPMVIGEGDRWALGLFTSAQKGLHVVPSRAPSRVCLIHAADLAPVLVRAVERGARVLTICSGAFVLGHAGLLDGRRATTHWRYINELRERFPAVQVEDDVLYVEDGPLITSAGSAAGIDAGLHLIRQDFGTEVANRVARRLVMPAHREGGQAQYVETPVAPRPGRTLAPVLDWARARLDTPLSVDTLAARAAMSPRTFLRRFEATVGTPPHAWLQHERMARARALLEGGALPLAQVAEQCGYASGETFRAAFRRVVGVAPGAYRARFGRGGG